jgi:hypothetical protein
MTEEEYAQVKQHRTIGAKIIEPIEAYADAIPLILQHHERFDGKGYPDASPVKSTLQRKVRHCGRIVPLFVGRTGMVGGGKCDQVTLMSRETV